MMLLGETLLSILGQPMRATVAEMLDGRGRGPSWPDSANRYKGLMLDGLVLPRKTGARALRRSVRGLWDCVPTA